ncbi:hypothetical protein ACFQ1S_08235 [Kibdelosporangium lantanae]|uniref:Uncharacterized protein n=1 Tax=Kibdelosporangium lantanae TaxID=1497396 RepID=A0ABW3M9F7_9PSEU
MPSDFPRLARALGIPETDLALTLAADVLEADKVETAILKQDVIPMNVRHSLVTLYKEILGKYTSGQASEPV